MLKIVKRQLFLGHPISMRLPVSMQPMKVFSSLQIIHRLMVNERQYRANSLHDIYSVTSMETVNKMVAGKIYIQNTK